MSLSQILPLLEMLLINIYALHCCCNKKFSAARTFITLGLFTLVFGTTLFALSYKLPFHGDGKFFFLGFIYLIPFVYLYQENIFVLFTIMCTCWTYTLGILSLSLQFAGMFGDGNAVYILVSSTVLFIATLIPFHRLILPKYIFILAHSEFLPQHWNKNIALTACLHFLLLMVLNQIFLLDDPSLFKIFALILTLFSIFTSYFILYKIVLDAIKMNQLEHAALHDPLTGLGNRASLLKHLHLLLETDQTFSILFMDLDRFKQINDQYGHSVGDQYLKHFAEISSNVLRDGGKVYRFGGDEFIALYYGVISPEIIDVLKTCPTWDPGAPCPFNQVSAGVLLCQPPHKNINQILQQVDRLMYQNKQKKRSHKFP